ncbi:universal stress protein [Prauserella oleivorans]|uniref:Universal stress protein n=1 Tax=Prauserella oleivorans TaxID=1478153 RepID=A0ABW5WA42_9PSEU
MGKIVAGIDGSASAKNAAVWAAREAARRQDTLRLVHAYVVPAGGYPTFVARLPQLREGMQQQGREWLDEARDAVLESVSGLEVETDLIEGQPAAVLTAESRTARSVVLGSRGLGGFTGMLVGSVAVSLAAHGHSPVAVVRGRRPADPVPTEGPVVVGVDGSEPGAAALALAFDAASVRKTPLVAVHVWNDVTADAGLGVYPLAVDPDELARNARTVLDEALSEWQSKYPDVTVEPVVARGRPVRTLLEYAERAQLVVVGSRGRGGFQGMLLGSTSQALVIHSPCPVVVTRAEDAEA